MGPITPLSFPGSNKYIQVFVDDFTRFAKTFCIQNKSEAGDCLESFIKHPRNLVGKNEKVCFLQADNAQEIVGGEFNKILKKEAISSNLSPPHTPEVNGVSERFNKSLAN